jgi:hypothetical protein
MYVYFGKERRGEEVREKVDGAAIHKYTVVPWFMGATVHMQVRIYQP